MEKNTINSVGVKVSSGKEFNAKKLVMEGVKGYKEIIQDREVIDLMTVMGINGDKGVRSNKDNNEGIKSEKGGRSQMKKKE